MSLAVGLVAEDGVWLGTDTGGMTSAGDCGTYKNPKIIRYEDPPMLLAIGGSWYMGSLLKWDLEPPEPPPHKDALDYLESDFARAVKRLFLESGYAGQDEDGKPEGGAFLIAYAGRLFVFQPDWSVLEPVRGYEAMGYGDGEARGVLWATQDVGLGGEERVLLALEAGAEHNVFLRRPFVVERL